MRALLRTTALLAMLSPALAGAAPALRGDISVTDGVVTVGDMFADAGDLATTALFRAPEAGTAGTVTLAEIEAAALRIGLTDFDAAGLDAVRVARPGVVIDRALIEGLIIADLEARGIMTEAMSIGFSFDSAVPEMIVPAVARPATLELLRYYPGSASLSARFAITGSATPLEVNAQVQMMVAVPHLAGSVPAGAVLMPADITLREVPLAQAEAAGMPEMEMLVGMQVRRALREGVMLRAEDVAPPQLIARNQDVTIVYRSGALTLTARGQALNAASLDQPVSVLNGASRKIVSGIAAADGTVVVTTAHQTVAGL